VVGRRVVIRWMLPDGRATDVLGVCEAWSDEEALVRTEDGAAVSIPTHLIVTGKPVPPRPSVRQRVSVREAESHAAGMWPGVHREPLGAWELRSEPEPPGRLRKRVNSCLAIGDPGIAFDEAVAAVLSFYTGRGRDPLVQVEADAETEAAFAARGWQVVPGGDASFLLGSVASARRRLGAAEALGTLAVADDRLTVRTDAGSGAAYVHGDWIGVHDLVVLPEHRRQGVASGLLATLLEAGAERGATTVWLHVETDNDAALRLYEGLGLTEHHGCRYLAPPS
jgi:ribosomal protein S18 acetylase RimI-like enzyme